MAVTHFSIESLPDPNVITSKISGGNITIGQLYPIAQESVLTFDKTLNFENKAFTAPFQYKTHDTVNNITSNQAFGNLKWSGILAPASSNLTQNISNMQIINIFDILPLNNSVEYIEIVSLEGLQALRVNGMQAFVGQKITTLELFYTTYTSLDMGGGLPYFKMQYKVGKNNISEATVYDLVFNLSALAELSTNPNRVVSNFTEDIDENGVITTYEFIEEEIIVEIKNGQTSGTAQLEININSAFLANNVNNTIQIDYGSEDFETDQNIISNIEVELDQEGAATLSIINSAVHVGSVVGNIKITLQSINNSPSFVNGSQIENILTNL